MAAMGLEAECTVRVGRKSSVGKALLESETLIFRGDFSLQLPFAEIRDVSVDGADLVAKTSDQEVRFELGAPMAERWLRQIKEPKGLFEKLDVGPQTRVAVVDVRDSLFLTALRDRAQSVAEGRVPEGVPVVFFGAETREALRMIHLLRTRMVDNGVLWVVRPKGSKTISEKDVYEAVRAASLVDTKVVSFSKTHTAHKCVIPLELRGQPVRIRPPVITIPPSAPTLPKKPAAKPKKAAKPAKPAAKSAPKKKPAPAKAKPKPKQKK
jgi:hypothetical protein